MLGLSTVPLTVRRTDAQTLELSSNFSVMWNPGSQLLIGPDTHFSPGDERVVRQARIRVLEVDHRGAPLRFSVHLPKSLDDPHYLFLKWAGATYATFTPPAIGEEVTLPAADYLQTLFGKKMFVEAKYSGF